MNIVEKQRNTAIVVIKNQIKKNAKRMVWVTFAFEGIHAYPDAAASDDGGRYDVSFLQYPHRHMFHFKVGIEIFHNDREIEFIQFKRFCEGQFGDTTEVIQLNNNSVEMLADKLYDKIGTGFPGRDVCIDVSEDQENGCHIEYTNRRFDDS